MLTSSVADVAEQMARTEPAAFAALDASVRASARGHDHLLGLWLDGLREAYLTVDATPQDQARLRVALAGLRRYAGLTS